MAILFIATVANIFAMWYFFIREESVDWISSQVLHQPSPYAVIGADGGEAAVENMISGYVFSLPKGFKTAGARNLTFYLEENGVKKCEIKHFYLKAGRAPNQASKAERIVLPFNGLELTYELIRGNKEDCGQYLEQITLN